MCVCEHLRLSTSAPRQLKGKNATNAYYEMIEREREQLVGSYSEAERELPSEGSMLVQESLMLLCAVYESGRAPGFAWKVAGEYLCFAKARAVQHSKQPGRCVRLYERAQLFEILQNLRRRDSTATTDVDGDDANEQADADADPEREATHLSQAG